MSSSRLRADNLDKLDMDILAGLASDSSISIPKLARKINSNTSVTYARVRRLKNNKIISRYKAVINEQILGYTVKALVGINMNSRKRSTIIKALLQTDGVSAISEVTGRFDILITVFARTLDEMHEVVSEKIGKIDGIVSSETFIEMKSIEKDMPYVATGSG